MERNSRPQEILSSYASRWAASGSSCPLGGQHCQSLSEEDEMSPEASTSSKVNDGTGLRIAAVQMDATPAPTIDRLARAE